MTLRASLEVTIPPHARCTRAVLSIMREHQRSWGQVLDGCDANAHDLATIAEVPPSYARAWLTLELVQRREIARGHH